MAEQLNLTCRIVDRPGIAFDLDTPLDLEEFRAATGDEWLASV
jgi:hypothetical protein